MTPSDSYQMQQSLKHTLLNNRIIVEIEIFQGQIIAARAYPSDLTDTDAWSRCKDGGVLNAVGTLVGATPDAANAAVAPNGPIVRAWQAASSSGSGTPAIAQPQTDATIDALQGSGWSR